VGADRTGDTTGQTRWSSARGERSRGSERASMYSRRGASGRRCRRICRRKAPRIPTSCYGIGTARWSASITHSISRPASVKGARRARRPRSSTARAPGPLKKGRRARPAGPRCGQKGHRAQAPHPGRYAWPSVERRRPSRRCSGPRRGAAGSRSAHALPFPFHRADLRRCRLSRTARRASRCLHRPLGVEIVKRNEPHNSSSCPSAGSSNEPWPGLAAIAAWRVISSDIRAPSLPSSGSP